MLQAIAAIAGLAILLWSLGLPSLRFADAANLLDVSDTLSTSEPSVTATHTFVFTTPTGESGSDIVISFEDSSFDISTVGAEDITISTTTAYSVQNGAGAGQVWGVATSSGATRTITLQNSGSIVLDPYATVTIAIADIVNPGVGSYGIDIDTGTDVGGAHVAIVSPVVVTAAVDTSLTFTVGGVNGGTTVNGTTTTGATTDTTIPFGTLEVGVASTAAQSLAVVTNAANGFVVTTQMDGMLRTPTGSDIDGFIEGAYTDTPTDWQAPVGVAGQENTYGHWGVTTNDTSITESLNDYFADQQYVSASTSPIEVFRHDGPADGTTAHVGLTQVAYTVQINGLQEAATDYTAEIVYVATPVF